MSLRTDQYQLNDEEMLEMHRAVYVSSIFKDPGFLPVHLGAALALLGLILMATQSWIWWIPAIVPVMVNCVLILEFLRKWRKPGVISGIDYQVPSRTCNASIESDAIVISSADFTARVVSNFRITSTRSLLMVFEKGPCVCMAYAIPKRVLESCGGVDAWITATKKLERNSPDPLDAIRQFQR